MQSNTNHCLMNCCSIGATVCGQTSPSRPIVIAIETMTTTDDDDGHQPDDSNTHRNKHTNNQLKKSFQTYVNEETLCSRHQSISSEMYVEFRGPFFQQVLNPLR